jgi:hypothetical protein
LSVSAIQRLQSNGMDLHRISDSDKAIVGQALRAAADGPFFPDWEFDTIFGLTRNEVRAIAHAWPNVELNRADVAVAVNNSLNNLLGYPLDEAEGWNRWISVSPSQLGELFCRLRNSASESYFDRLM